MEYESEIDRYQEFRKVFGTEEGQRVFKEIVSWGRPDRPLIPVSPIDPYMAVYRDAERNYANRIIYTYNNEPKQKPDKQKRTP